MTRATERVVKTDLLNAALLLVQKRGYQGFSYYDLARIVGVKTATIHYYFPTKADLATALIQQYSQTLQQEFTAIMADTADVRERLRRFAMLFVATYRDDGRICLGGALAMEMAALGEATRESVRAFFRLAEDWLAQVLAAGVAEQQIALCGTPEQTARSLLALLEGAQLAARAFDDPVRLEELPELVVSMLGVPA
ncbi:MAG: TetR/AcrR family transcriptional regulator [Roseiflexaceae bacterium]